MPAAGRPPAPAGQVEIVVSINGVPANYDAKIVTRLLLGAMRGAGYTASIVGIKVDPGTGPSRSATVTAKSDLAESLTIAGQRADCNTGSCQISVVLNDWTLDASQLPPYVEPIFAPGISLVSPTGWEPEFVRLGINNQFLPKTPIGNPAARQYLLHLFDDSHLRVELRSLAQAGNNAPNIDIPSGEDRRGLRLSKLPEQRQLNFRLMHARDIAGAPVASNSPAPTVDSQRQISGAGQPAAPNAVQRPQAGHLHIAIKPLVPGVPGWTADRAAQRLKTLLERNGYRALAKTADGREIPSQLPSFDLTRSRDGVVVWSGDALLPHPEVIAESLPPGISFDGTPPRTENASQAWNDRRVLGGDIVQTYEMKIGTSLLYDKWQISIEPFNRIYNQDMPDTSNEQCQFSLSAASGGTGNSIVLDRTSGFQGKRVLQASVEASYLPKDNGALRLIVHPKDGFATCARTTADLRPLSHWTISEDRERNGVLATRAPVPLRGRWLLGLYAPQDLGVGVAGSAQFLDDARNDIFNRFTAFLDTVRAQHFPNSPPASSALGFDLALLPSGEVTAPEFQQSNVITGKFRQNPTLSFRLDGEGDRRLINFLSGPGSAGSPPDVRAITQTIERYAKLFGEPEEGYPPAVLYVGSVTPYSDTCRRWAELSQEIAGFGKPRVIGILFANAASAKIEQDLGRQPEPKPILLAQRTRGYSCQGANGSAILFVPFPDLLARTPDVVLEAIFSQVDKWLSTQ